MDESNMSEDDGKNRDEDDERNTNNKRIRIQSDQEDDDGCSSSLSKEQEQGTSGSSHGEESKFAKSSRSLRNRNYRSKSQESSANESADDENVDPTLQTPLPEALIDVSSLDSSGDSLSTVIIPSDSGTDEYDDEAAGLARADTNEDEADALAVLKKPKPKHTWFVVPEVLKRQTGCSSKLYAAELFRNRCYGSLHNVERLELMYKLEEHTGCVNSLNFSPDGSLLASGSDDLHIVIWDWKVGKKLLKYNTKHRMNIFQSKFLHLGGDLHIASCARDGQVRIARLCIEGGVRENRKLGSHRATCHKLAVLPDQPHVILSAGEDAVVLSHDLRKPKSERIVLVEDNDKEIPLYTIQGHPLRTHEFCVGGKDDVVRVYDQRKSNASLFTYHPFKRNEVSYYRGLHVTSAVYNYNGSHILASYNDAGIYLFDVDDAPGEFVHRYEGHRNDATIKGVNFFGPRSEFVVSGSDCGNIFFWERDTEAIVQCISGDENGVVNCLEPHPTLPYLCTSGLDWDVKVWVPSDEEGPHLDDLPETVKNNHKPSRSFLDDVSEAPVLWMLWRHLRNTRYIGGTLRPSDLFRAGSSSDSDNEQDIEEPDEDDEDLADVDFASECTTS